MSKETVRRFKVVKELKYNPIPKGQIVGFKEKEFLHNDPREKGASDGRISFPSLVECMPEYFEEVIEEPYNTEVLKAVNESIDHWVNDILVPITKGEELHRAVHRTPNCSLCAYCGFKTTSCILPNCDNCPLQKCNKDGSIWKAYNTNQTPENALKMIQALQECKKSLEEKK